MYGLFYFSFAILPCRIEASIKECACANLYTASDTVIILKKLITKLQDKQYAMNLPLYEIFNGQHIT